MTVHPFQRSLLFMPWYVTALLVSQPLHFGDYGGMPLKILWALLDIATVVVLGSGLYLWVKRGQRLAVEAGGPGPEEARGALPPRSPSPGSVPLGARRAGSRR